MVTFNSAAQAYGRTAGLGNINQGIGAKPKVESAVNEFAKHLGAEVEALSQSGKQAEKLGTDMLIGKGNAVGVVTAMAETEIVLETMVTVRDRVIAAYEEIMRMPI